MKIVPERRLRIRRSLSLLAAALLAVSWPAPAAVTGVHAGPAHIQYVDGEILIVNYTGPAYVYFGGQRHLIEDKADWVPLGYLSKNFAYVNDTDVSGIVSGAPVQLQTVGSGLVYPLAPIACSPITFTLGQASISTGQDLALSGRGFSAGETVNLEFGGTTQPVGADANGAFSALISVPSTMAQGLQPVFAQGATSHSFGMEFVHVTPAMSTLVTAVPAQAAPGSTIAVSGSGFAANETVDVFLSTSAAAETTAGAQGTFGPVSLPVSSSLATGTYPLVAYGKSSTGSAVTQVVVSPAVPTPLPVTVAVVPGTVQAGNSIVLSGSGFSPNEKLTIQLGTTTIFTTAADLSGNFSGLSYAIPVTMAAGTYPVTVYGATSSRMASASLTVTTGAIAAIAAVPQSARPGDSVVITGTGFLANENVAVSLGSSVVAHATADAGGTFRSGPFAVPELAAGDYTLKATGAGSGRTATATLIVLTAPHATVQPNSVEQGKDATLAGVGFDAGETIQVKEGSVVLTTVTADANGGFSVSIGAKLKVGRHVLTVAGTASGRSAQAALTVSATVAAKLTLSSATSPSGGTITASGDHFQAGEAVSIRLAGSLLLTTRANAKGQFSRVAVHLPRALRAGRYYIGATGNTSKRSATAAIQIESAQATGIALSTGRVRAGQTVVVSGRGFGTSEIVLVSLRGAVLTAVMSSAQGSFQETITVPAHAPLGSTAIVCTGVKSKKHAQATIVIVAG